MSTAVNSSRPALAGGGRAAHAGSQAMAPIFQLHVTRRCNLRCMHCYSQSGPRQRDTLAHEEIIEALTGARAQGYEIASFSGGEPVLYRNLSLALRHAKSLGMRTTVTSNGMLLAGARLDALRDHTDVLAISLDGMPESHDRMRDCPGAFERMATNLDAVRATGIDFGFIFTLTLHNVHELEWAASFAHGQGAKLFQIHPLEEVGRAADDLPGSRPDALEAAYAYLETERIRQLFQGRMFVQLDLFHREHLARDPARFYAEAEETGGANEAAAALADVILAAAALGDGNLAPARLAAGALANTALADATLAAAALGDGDLAPARLAAGALANTAVAVAAPADAALTHGYLAKARLAKATLVEPRLADAAPAGATFAHGNLAKAQLADYVTPLVLEADGNLVPIGYGFGHRYAIGNVRGSSMQDLASHWIADVYPEFRALCRRVYAEAIRPSKLPFINWYEMLQAASGI